MQLARSQNPEQSFNEPPFRAEHVGSLLRPEYLLQAREQFANKEIYATELRVIEDRAIKDMVKKQEVLGLEVVTDGELRRAYFHLDFMEQLQGIEITGAIAASSDAGATVGFTPPKMSVTGKLSHNRPIQLDDFNYLQSVTTKTPKISIPSPTMAHFRGGRASISKDAYPDLEEFYSDLAACYRQEIETLYAAGCRYIQLDDTNLAYLCDTKMCEDARNRGEDPEQLPQIYADLINDAIRHDHDDLYISIHLCRGNFRSTWFSQGSYDAVAEILFNKLNVDSYFLEYDDERSGGFEPLRFVPAQKKVVLGLVTSKTPEIENHQEIISRIEEASRYLPLDNLCLSPQCGFASTHHGNNLSESEQWEKLAFVKRIADEVWK